MAGLGEVISYLEMCREWGVSFQRGMYFRLKKNTSVLLMSRRTNAPYRDRIEDDGRVLIYEGHDVPKIRGGPDPKSVSQPRTNPGGSLTQNGLFAAAANAANKKKHRPEVVAVYEKIRPGIWTFNGLFRLTDAYKESDGVRDVFKFRLELTDEISTESCLGQVHLLHNRLIPSAVKIEVWKRDKGQCVKCGSKKNLHFDHVVPFSKGGSSLVVENIQLLCALHNIEKRDKIQ